MSKDAEVLYRQKKDILSYWWLWVLFVIVTIVLPPAGIVLLLLALALLLYSLFFFKGSKFTTIKNKIRKHIGDCNELNQHIEDLRSAYANIHKTDYGEASFTNVSKYNYTNEKVRDAKYAPNIYDCTRSVCDNARKQPFKYICKYFNIVPNEETINDFEEVLNSFSSAEEGKLLLAKKKELILRKIDKKVPWVIKSFFPKKLEDKLGFEDYIFNELYFPTFSFRYISPGGKSGTQYDVRLDTDMLERFISYLADLVKFKNSAAGQRRLMTQKLRRYIIERDQNTCQKCGNSTAQEPNLLLEVDHIIPVSKGGLTSEDNLQTLCWKCNRSKGAKVV